jgi:hypothetical protein
MNNQEPPPWCASRSRGAALVEVLTFSGHNFDDVRSVIKIHGAKLAA